MKEIRTAIIGVGNCASALVQGRFYYADPDAAVPGLITRDFGGYLPQHIRFVAAFDVDARKVGLDLSQAIFSPPNRTTVFQRGIPHLDCPVRMGYIIDSIAPHNEEYPEQERFVPLANVYATEEEAKEAVVRVLREARVDVVINYLPVGSEKNVVFYADCAIEAGCALVNAMPVFLSEFYGERFREAGLPILGDDIKSQVGATIIHRVLTRLFADRGQPVKRIYQLNVGGNTDFLNMLDQNRLTSKRISKTQAVTSQMDGDGIDPRNIYVGPSDYIPWLNDRKLCFLRIEAEQFGGVPMYLDLRLSVEDSPNSAGVVMEALRAAKVALDRGTCRADRRGERLPLQVPGEAVRGLHRAADAAPVCSRHRGDAARHDGTQRIVNGEKIPAVILAAGKGERLTSDEGRPKPLIPLLGLSLLERTILSCREAGIEEFFVVLGHRGEEIEPYLARWERHYHLSITPVTNPNWEEGNGTERNCCSLMCPVS